jgi:hypothetical protein
MVIALLQGTNGAPATRWDTACIRLASNNQTCSKREPSTRLYSGTAKNSSSSVRKGTERLIAALSVCGSVCAQSRG